MIKGEGGGLTILESVPAEVTLEELFLGKLMSVEGVEEFCLPLLAQKRLNHQRLLDLSVKMNMVNIVGCYLDVVNNIKELVPPDVVRQFHDMRTKEQQVYLASEKQYGKEGWETPFEKRWNIDLYLDLGAIKHGIRAL